MFNYCSKFELNEIGICVTFVPYLCQFVSSMCVYSHASVSVSERACVLLYGARSLYGGCRSDWQACCSVVVKGLGTRFIV